MPEKPDHVPLPLAKQMAPSIRRGPVTLTPRDLAGRISRRIRIVMERSAPKL